MNKSESGWRRIKQSVGKGIHYAADGTKHTQYIYNFVHYDEIGDNIFEFEEKRIGNRSIERLVETDPKRRAAYFEILDITEAEYEKRLEKQMQEFELLEH